MMCSCIAGRTIARGGLVQAGLVEKEKLTGRCQSVRYSLTKRGARVARLVRELDKV